jgi:Skp family chaperone for outer membrane proteins
MKVVRIIAAVAAIAVFTILVQTQTRPATPQTNQIKRKAEDAQAAYQKDSLAVLGPLQKDVFDSLNAYAQAKGISLLIDVSRVPVIYAASHLDVTRDFIAEYNRTHPATASAPAKP